MDMVRSCHCHFPLTYLRSVRGAGELCFEAWGAINYDLPVKTDGASIETFTVNAVSSKKKPWDQDHERNIKKLHTHLVFPRVRAGLINTWIALGPTCLPTSDMSWRGDASWPMTFLSKTWGHIASILIVYHNFPFVFPSSSHFLYQQWFDYHHFQYKNGLGQKRLCVIISGWWLTHPSEKWWGSSVGVTIPKWMESHKIPWFQTTKQLSHWLIYSWFTH